MAKMQSLLLAAAVSGLCLFGVADSTLHMTQYSATYGQEATLPCPVTHNAQVTKNGQEISLGTTYGQTSAGRLTIKSPTCRDAGTYRWDACEVDLRVNSKTVDVELVDPTRDVVPLEELFGREIEMELENAAQVRSRDRVLWRADGGLLRHAGLTLRYQLGKGGRSILFVLNSPEVLEKTDADGCVMERVNVVYRTAAPAPRPTLISIQEDLDRLNQSLQDYKKRMDDITRRNRGVSFFSGAPSHTQNVKMASVVVVMTMAFLFMV